MPQEINLGGILTFSFLFYGARDDSAGSAGAARPVQCQLTQEKVENSPGKSGLVGNNHWDNHSLVGNNPFHWR